MKKTIIPLVLATALVFSCKSKKNQQTVNSMSESVAMDSLMNTVKGLTVEPKVYTGSETRINDLIHTKLEVNLDWNNAWLMGKATLDLKPYFHPTSTLLLDARGMDIYKVQLLKANAALDLKYTYERDSLKIVLDKTYSRNETYQVYIEYKSKPNELKTGGSEAIQSDRGLFFINPKAEDPNKMPQIWTQGETQSNSVWFPTIDKPNERMTNELFITVQDKYTTLSNGILVSQRKNPDGTRTDYWKMDLPHAPYLVMMGIGEFQKIIDKPFNGKEISYYVEKKFEPHAKAIFGNTREMMEFFSAKLGVPYAWPKYAQIVVRDYVSGAMENTSATLHGDFLYQTKKELIDGSRGEDVISHELFHQWFGDLVTCESWSNLPLNESFATYGEYLWQEYKYGKDAAEAHSLESRNGYFKEAIDAKKDLIRFELTNREDMFDSHSYNKGGQILHMLRGYVGDEAFFSSLKLYLEKNKFKSVEIHDLRLAFEEVTGEDLNWFFNQWFLAKGHPELAVSNSYHPETKKIKLTVRQLQDLKVCPLYRLPVSVDFYFGEGAQKKVKTEKICITKADQEFEFDAESQPEFINFDSEKQLLAIIKQDKKINEYVYQYHNAPTFLDRMEALESFNGYVDRQDVFETVIKALKDKWQGHRLRAIKLLVEAAEKKEAVIKPLMIDISKTDSNSQVRAGALNFISEFYKGDELNTLYESRLSDSSYAVITAALAALAIQKPELAIEKAMLWENEESNDMHFGIMYVYSRAGNENQHGFFAKHKNLFFGYEQLGFISLYSEFLNRCSANTLIEGLTYIKDCAQKEKEGFFKGFIQNMILGHLEKYNELENELKVKLESSKSTDTNYPQLSEQYHLISSIKEKINIIYMDSKK